MNSGWDGQAPILELPAAEIKKHVERIVQTSKSGGVMLRSPAEVFGTERVKKSHRDPYGIVAAR